MRMAERIKALAVRRSGELLAQIQPAHGADQNIGAGGRTIVETRESAARDDGMSKHQQVQGTRIAAVPVEAFERQVESPKPTTLTQLAAQGFNPRPLVDSTRV